MKFNKAMFAMLMVCGSVVMANEVVASVTPVVEATAPVAEVSKFAALKTQATELGAKVSAKIAQQSLNAKVVGLSAVVAAAVLSPFVSFNKPVQEQAPKTMFEKAQDKFNNAVSYVNTQVNSAKNNAIAHPYMTSGALTAVVVAGAAYAYTQAEDQN